MRPKCLPTFKGSIKSAFSGDYNLKTQVSHPLFALKGHQFRVALICLKANAFWPEAISTTLCRVAQYLGIEIKPAN
jgi:hypothetical protein